MHNLEKERQDYLNYLGSIKKLKAVIIGQDPYPQSSTGIAFCKSSYIDLFNSKCSGKYVLNSIGIKDSVQKKKGFENPFKIFYYLFDNGIVFLNISNEILKGAFIKGQTKKKFNERLFIENEKIIKSTKEYNLPFLKKADKIFILGNWKTKPIFDKYYSEFKAEKVLIHPSNFNATDPKKKKEWDSTYLEKYLLTLIKK